MAEIKKIAILTGGGDCPGLNAVIRAVTQTAIRKYNLEVVGIRRGYHGLYYKDFVKLDLQAVEEILEEGGTILKSSNKDNLFKYPVRDENGEIVKKDGEILYEDVSDIAVQNLKDEGIDALFILGGDGTLTSGRDFARKGVNVIGIPKTIDNDLNCTDYTFGFDTAVNVIADCLDRIRTTGRSHGRIMVAEIMGRGAGWLALHGGIAGGADIILLPEIPFDYNKIAEKLKEIFASGKEYAIIACAEGAKSKDGETVILKVREDSPDPIRLGGIAQVVADKLEHLTGVEARAAVLGHIQRGGTTAAQDRVLSSRYGYAAVELAMKGQFGNMVILRGNKIEHASLEDVIGQKARCVPLDNELVEMAKSMGVYFGD